ENNILTSLVREYRAETGNLRHMKCAELHCIAKAFADEKEIRGAKMRSVTVGDAFGKEHGTAMAPCDRHCARFLPWLDISAKPSGFPEDWHR
ncbi:hypothetical protein, partial [Paractinoplanes durhamensis]